MGESEIKGFLDLKIERLQASSETIYYQIKELEERRDFINNSGDVSKYQEELEDINKQLEDLNKIHSKNLERIQGFRDNKTQVTKEFISINDLLKRKKEYMDEMLKYVQKINVPSLEDQFNETPVNEREDLKNLSVEEFEKIKNKIPEDLKSDYQKIISEIEKHEKAIQNMLGVRVNFNKIETSKVDGTSKYETPKYLQDLLGDEKSKKEEELESTKNSDALVNESEEDKTNDDKESKDSEEKDETHKSNKEDTDKSDNNNKLSIVFKNGKVFINCKDQIPFIENKKDDDHKNVMSLSSRTSLKRAITNNLHIGNEPILTPQELNNLFGIAFVEVDEIDEDDKINFDKAEDLDLNAIYAIIQHYKNTGSNNKDIKENIKNGIRTYISTVREGSKEVDLVYDTIDFNKNVENRLLFNEFDKQAYMANKEGYAEVNAKKSTLLRWKLAEGFDKIKSLPSRIKWYFMRKKLEEGKDEKIEEVEGNEEKTDTNDFKENLKVEIDKINSEQTEIKNDNEKSDDKEFND